MNQIDKVKHVNVLTATSQSYKLVYSICDLGRFVTQCIFIMEPTRIGDVVELNGYAHTLAFQNARIDVPDVKL